MQVADTSGETRHTVAPAETRRDCKKVTKGRGFICLVSGFSFFKYFFIFPLQLTYNIFLVSDVQPAIRHVLDSDYDVITRLAPHMVTTILLTVFPAL